MKRLALWVPAAALVLTACTGGGQRATIITTSTTTPNATSAQASTTTLQDGSSEVLDGGDTAPTAPAESAADAVAYGPAAKDRIVVTTQDGSIILVDPDGTDRLVLHDGADGRGAFPVWAPSGERIAWSIVAAGAFGQPEFTTVTSNVDGSNPTTMITPFATYYTAWDSTSRTLAVLGNDTGGRPGTALAIGIADRDSVATRLDAGTPSYYFTWDASGPGLLAHTADGVRFITPGEDPRSLSVGAGLYQPPLVTGEPGVVVFGQGSDSLGLIRKGRMLSGEVSNLATYQGNAWMMMHPDGTKIAIQTTGRLSEPDPENDPVAPDDLQMLDRGVYVLDLNTAEATKVSEDPVVAFFWSPDGEKLLLADFQPLDGISFLQWRMWSDNALRDVGQRFTPSTMFGGRILPFFDQYAISGDIWAPDSTRFTFSAKAPGGDEGVWVYDLITAAATLIFEGATLSFWSPT